MYGLQKMEIIWSHTANRTCDRLGQYGGEVIDHPPLQSQSRDFHMFRLHLAGSRFATDANMKQAVNSWLQMLDTDIIYNATLAFLSEYL